MLKYYQVFAKRKKPLLPEPKLSDFHNPSDGKKKGEILPVTVGTVLATYAIYKQLK